MKYWNPKEIKSNYDKLLMSQRRVSWDVRSGKISSLMESYVPNRSSKILDCGCANGAFLKQLEEEGYENIQGLDIDDYRTEDSRKFKFKKADISLEAIPWSDNYFDCVVSIQTIEHLESPHHFIREAFRVLKPQGIFIISTPNPFHILNRLLFLFKGDLYHFLENDNHITFFTRSIFRKTVLKYFELLGIKYAKPEFKFRTFNRIKFFKKILPTNQWFSRYIYYILRK